MATDKDNWTEMHFLRHGDRQRRGSQETSGDAFNYVRPPAGSAATRKGNPEGMNVYLDAADKAGLNAAERRASGAIDGHWASGTIGHGSADALYLRDHDEYAVARDGVSDRIEWATDWPEDDNHPQVRPVGKDSQNG